MPDYPERIVRYSELRLLQRLIIQQVRRLPDSFRFRSDWEQYREELARFLCDSLPIMRPSSDQSAVVTAEAPLSEDLTIESVDVPLDDEFSVPVHVYRPAVPRGGRSGVVVCPGYAQLKNDSCVADMCIALARNGMVAVAVEYGGTGERADRPDPGTDINNVTALGHLMGISNIGLRVYTNLAAFEYLKARPDVDNRRIGITGLCQGAIVTWFTAAVETGFAAVAPLCGATTYEAIALEYVNRQGGWSGISPYLFNMLSKGDVQHVIASIAPRPLLVQNNIIDKHWPMSGFGTVKRFVTSIYELYDAADRVEFRVEHAPHAFAEPFVSAIVCFFSDALGATPRARRAGANERDVP